MFSSLLSAAPRRSRRVAFASVALVALLAGCAPASSSSSSSKSNGNSAIVQLGFFALIGLAMYFVLIRPQRRRMRDAQQLLSKLSEGDEIITTGGIYGFINAIDGDTIWLDVADNVELRVHRSAIARRIDPAKEPAGGNPASGSKAGDDLGAASIDETDIKGMRGMPELPEDDSES